jgi:hypothetical protein
MSAALHSRKGWRRGLGRGGKWIRLEEWKTFLWCAMLARPPSHGRHFQKDIAMMTGTSARRDSRRLPHGAAKHGEPAAGLSYLEKESKNEPNDF